MRQSEELLRETQFDCWAKCPVEGLSCNDLQIGVGAFCSSRYYHFITARFESFVIRFNTPVAHSKSHSVTYKHVAVVIGTVLFSQRWK
jgi:hypothetical protein